MNSLSEIEFENGLKSAVKLNQIYWNNFDSYINSYQNQIYAEDVPIEEVKRRIYLILNGFTDLLLQNEQDESKVDLAFIKPNINLCSQWDPILNMFFLSCNIISWPLINFNFLCLNFENKI